MSRSDAVEGSPVTGSSRQLEKLRMAPSQQPSRKRGLQLHSCKELNSAGNPRERRRGPWPPRRAQPRSSSLVAPCPRAQAWCASHLAHRDVRQSVVFEGPELVAKRYAARENEYKQAEVKLQNTRLSLQPATHSYPRSFLRPLGMKTRNTEGKVLLNRSLLCDLGQGTCALCASAPSSVKWD